MAGNDLTIFPYLLAIIFAIVGLLMYFFPLKKINYLYGYRTPNAMKNIDNWKFAQTYAAKLMIFGGVFLGLSGLVLKLIFKMGDSQISLYTFLTMILVVGVIFFRTEYAIKKFEKSL